MVGETKAVDCLIIPNRPEEGSNPAPFVSHLFPDMAERTKTGITAEQLVAEMDGAGVEKGVLSIQTEADRDWVVDVAREYKGRFALAMAVNPLDGMNEIRRVTRYVNDYGIQVLRFGPWRIQKPPTDAVYYPFYVKAIELGLIVQINVGMPGPKYPGWTQDPIYVDQVCFAFPELTVMMTHLGYPWHLTACNLLTKWENAYLATTSWAPKHYPLDVIRLLNTQCQDKMMWGTEYPVIPFGRALREIEGLPLRDHVRPKFLRDNALKILRFE